MAPVPFSLSRNNFKVEKKTGKPRLRLSSIFVEKQSQGC
jgi:hypothetical protein